MCGITGILAVSDGFALSDELVIEMRDRMVHRGPDDGGSWCSPKDRVALGHRRLSIVDLSPAGHQPMTNEDGSVLIAFNGEIYNHAALREELERKGHVYRSHTDTESIIHLYEEEGPRCVERLQGMFGLAIWDRRKRELFLARDRLGIKPLYYSQPAGGFVFASEIKALLAHPSITADLDEDAFQHYLTFAATPPPMTMFAGIKKLAPAERMTVRADGSVHSETYWSPMSQRARDEVAEMSDKDMEERLIELLRESIAKRMMSDVPFGVFLSGGVDSSTNVALMSELVDRPVRTFSVAFAGHEKYNELEYARSIATRYGTEHHEVIVDWKDARDFLPQLVHHQDEPMADWVCVPLYFVSKLARDNGTIVVQVGEGSDELLHGYDSYIRHGRFQQRYAPALLRLPKPVRRGAGRAARAVSSRAGRGLAYGRMLSEAADDRIPFWGGAVMFDPDLKDRILTNGRARADPYEIVERLWGQAERDLAGADVLQRMTFLELKQRLSELLLMRVDKMTMATSVEARVPFLDHAFVEYAVALPPRMKVRDGTGKYILKKAVEKLLPHEIVHRPKQGFGAPVPEWFRGEFGERVQQEIKSSSLAERGLIDYDELDTLWASHRNSGPSNWSQQLWNVYNVSAWHDQWVAGRAVS
jgi:asparagine synthase (glutamine-hydrolysing)